MPTLTTEDSLLLCLLGMIAFTIFGIMEIKNAHNPANKNSRPKPPSKGGPA
jgi:hypothetical protein